LEATLISPLGRTTLDFDTLRIGRAPDNQLIIDDPEAAAHHAEIKPSPDRAAHLVIDQCSTHGTFVNEERLPIHTPRPLNTGDVIRIGSLHFTYETTSITNRYEPTITANSSNHEHTVAATPDAISTNTADAAQNQSPERSPAYGTPPPPPDHSEQSYAQSAYPAPSLAQNGVSQRRKGRIGLWIAIAVVVLLVVAGSTWGAFSYVNRSTPTKTLQAFCTAFQKGDAQGLYNVLSKRAQAQASVDKLKAVFSFLEYAGGIENCTVGNIQENGSTAIGNVTMNLKGSKPGQPYPERLINEGGTWKIDDSPNQN
jgi:FlaG/FlaF family flagellin (archaellin)